jgi:AcrR family transcriptional regulator
MVSGKLGNDKIGGRLRAVTKRYHHGDLRRELIRHALAEIADNGVAALSLRDLARRAGVSHAAPAHHFHDKTGLLTAIATDGFTLLADTLDAAREHGFLETGVAYVSFAVDHPAHFTVMFSAVLDDSDPDLAAARARAGAVLEQGVVDLPQPPAESARGDAAIAAWSLVHGFATLWLNGALSLAPDADPTATARRIITALLTSEADPTTKAPDNPEAAHG